MYLLFYRDNLDFSELSVKIDPLTWFDPWIKLSQTYLTLASHPDYLNMFR